MIYEWKLDDEVRNFGHAIYEVLYSQELLWEWEANKDKMFFLGSSYIHEDHIIDALNLGYDPVFINCAWRGEPISDEFLEMASYRSVYGLNTEEMLSSRGVYADFEHHPIYDLPESYAKGFSTGFALAVRNIKDPGDYSEKSMFFMGVDGVLSTVVEDRADIMNMMDTITGSRFILSGSLKAAMVADAYGIPFAPLNADGYIDCPEKWTDWLSSMGIHEVNFCRNIREGREWYQDVVRWVKNGE